MQSSLLANDEFVIEPHPNDDYNYSYSNNTTNSTNSTNNTAPTPTRTYPIVQVIAPETLAQGYTFDVEFNHEILTVVVVRIVRSLLYICIYVYMYSIVIYLLVVVTESLGRKCNLQSLQFLRHII